MTFVHLCPVGLKVLAHSANVHGCVFCTLYIQYLWVSACTMGLFSGHVKLVGLSVAERHGQHCRELCLPGSEYMYNPICLFPNFNKD